MKALVKKGVDLDARDEDGLTALHVAAEFQPWRKTEEIVALLLASGADANVKDNQGRTPLHVAADPAVVQALLKAGADVNARDHQACTPLHAYSSLYHGLTTMGDRTDDIRPTPESRRRRRLLLQALLEHGADVTARNILGETPLHVASGYGKPGGEEACAMDTVQVLLSAGANANAKDNFGFTPLKEAADLGYEGVATLLRRHGAKE